MQPGTRNRLRIAVLIYSMTNAVIFGAGIITVLNISTLRDNAYIWISHSGHSEPYPSRAYSLVDRPASASTLRSEAVNSFRALLSPIVRRLVRGL